MSILVTSNIINNLSGFPYQPLPLIDLIDTTSFLKHNKLGYEVLDGQKYDFDTWVKQIEDKSPKILLVVLSEPYLQVLKDLKSKLSEEITVVVITENEDIINTLVFDYALDYVYFDKNKTGLGELLPALVNPFSMFYDHILGIAYKNGLGELTKTDQLGVPSDYQSVISKEVIKGYQQAYLPEPLNKEELDLEVINGVDQKVLVDFVKYNPKVQYDSFYLKLPASKKAKKFVSRIIEEQKNLDQLHVYPSCDVMEDQKFYSNIFSILDMSEQVRNAGWFSRIFLKMKLNKLL